MCLTFILFLLSLLLKNAKASFKTLKFICCCLFFIFYFFLVLVCKVSAFLSLLLFFAILRTSRGSSSLEVIIFFNTTYRLSIKSVIFFASICTSTGFSTESSWTAITILLIVCAWNYTFSSPLYALQQALLHCLIVCA